VWAILVQMLLPRSSCPICTQVKEKFRQRDESFKPFAGKTMAMIFTKPSMRTRISFETVNI
jgi:ornithine carbamoyltransferase